MTDDPLDKITKEDIEAGEEAVRNGNWISVEDFKKQLEIEHTITEAVQKQSEWISSLIYENNRLKDMYDELANIVRCQAPECMDVLCGAHWLVDDNKRMRAELDKLRGE